MDFKKIRFTVRDHWQMMKIVLFSQTLFFAAILSASPDFLTLRSRIIQPDGQNLEAASVNYRFSITDPVGTCVVYQEDFSNVSMVDSKGLVSIKIGSGTRGYPVAATTMKDVFTNFNSPVFNCQAGGTYTAASADQRKLVMQFNDGSGWQTVPAMEINSVPYSLESLAAQKLGSYPAADYVRSAQFTSCTGAEAVHFNGTNFTCVALSGGAAYSAITGATGTNTIDNTNYAQTWNWSTATTQNPMTMAANALTTGSLLNLTTSNNSLNSTNGILNVANTGTSTNGLVARIQSNSTAGSGLTVLANGNVGIGTSNPTSNLEVNGNIAMTSAGTLKTNDATSGNAGALIVRAGNVTAGNGSGGLLTLKGGDGFQQAGGNVSISGGAGIAVAGSPGGSIFLTGGTTAGVGTAAGSVNLYGGNGGSSGTAGTVGLTGGTASSGTGGAVNIDGGIGVLVNAGAVNITGGQALASGIGGNAILNGGAGATSNGNVILANLRGDVGIGTASPTSKLHVKASALGNQIAVDNGGGVDIFTVWTGSAQSANVSVKNSAGTTFSQLSADSGGYPTIYSNGSVNIGDSAASTTGAAMFIDIPGNLNDENGIFFGDSGNTALKPGGAVTYYRSDMTDNNVGGLKFKTRALAGQITTRMTIDENGKVGIGTTSPQTTLQVEGVISPATNNTYTLGNASYRFTEVYATNGVINTSDRREKKDIYNTDLGLDFINKLRPVSYRWNTGVDHDVHYGLIAQEAEQAIVESGRPEKTSIVTHDKATDRYGVRYSELISPLIKAFQELYDRLVTVDSEVATLKANDAIKDREIASLKAENAAIKARLDKIEKAIAISRD